MPYYVQLYEFEAKWRNVDDPLESYNLTETFEGDSSGGGTATGSTTDTSKQTSSSTGSDTSEKVTKFSDTPQGSISNIDNYLTNATKENGNGSTNSSGSNDVTATGSSTHSTTDTGHQSHTLTRKGNIGVQPLGGEVMNIRDAFINIDLMVINELKDLFLQVY